MDNDFKVILGAMIDNSSLTDVQKQLAKQRLKINADISVEDFAKSKQTIEKQISGLAKEIKSILGNAISDKQATQWANQYYNSMISGAKKATKEQESLANAMAKGREQAEKARQTEQQRQQLAQSNASNKALEQEYQQRQKIAKATENQSKKIQESLTTGGYNKQVKDLEAQFKKLGLSEEEVASKMESVKIAYDKLSSNQLSQEGLVQAEKKFNIELTTTSNHLKALKAEMSGFVSETNRLNKVSSMQKWADNNTKAMKKFGNEINNIIERMNDLDKPLSLNESTQLINRFKEIQNTARETGNLGLTFSDKFKNAWEKFGGWSLASGSMMKIVTEFKEAINFSVELNSALTNINYTMDVTANQLDKIGQKSISMAKDLNTSAENVLSAVKLYANAKETSDSIIQKAQPAIMLSNVSGFSGEQSAKYLQTIMNQFDLTQDDLMGISDTIQTVSQNMAHDFADGIVQINEGIETSGEVARAAGMDLAEYSSMIGLLVEKTGLAGSQLANGVKTIITRTTKAGKILGIDEGEISDAEKSLKNVGIAVRETDGEFREFDDTMRDLASVWDSLSDVEKSNIAFNLAGTRQINIIQTLLRNWSDYEALVEKANNSSGVTFENQEKYAESLEGKMKGLSATMTSAWDNIIGEDEVTPVVDGLIKIAEALDFVTDKLGLFGTLGAGAGLFAGLNNVGRDKMQSLIYVLNMPTIVCVL